MQHQIRPISTPFDTTMTVPGSRSLTHRAILIAALANGVTELSQIALDEETQTLIYALQQLGIVIQLDMEAASCIIAGGNGQFPKSQATVSCRQSINICHALLCLTAAANGVYYLDGDTNLRKHAIADLLAIITKQGCQLIPDDAQALPLTLVGADAFKGGEMILPKHVSNNAISTLLIQAAYARTPFTLTFPNATNCAEINMTIALMAEFGVHVEHLQHNKLTIPAPQRYFGHDTTIEPSYASAQYFFAGAAITCSRITITNMKNRHSWQSAAGILAHLEKMGCQFNESAQGLTLQAPNKLNGLQLTLSSFTNILPILTVLALFANSTSRFTHEKVISAAETTLLQQLQTELKKLGIQCELGSNWIEITPGNIHPNNVTTYNNPHIAMAFALIGLKYPGIIIENANCVKGLYTDFFNQWNALTEGRSTQT